MYNEKRIFSVTTTILKFHEKIHIFISLQIYIYTKVK